MLKSDREADVNVSIMRTFVRLRQVLATHEQLARKIEEHDYQIAMLFDNVQQLLAPEPAPEPARKAIGFPAPKR